MVIFMGFAFFEYREKNISGKAYCVSEPKSLKSLSNPLSFRIFFELSRKEAYPSEIAKKLGISQQKAFYFIRSLKESGLDRKSVV